MRGCKYQLQLVQLTVAVRSAGPLGFLWFGVFLGTRVCVTLVVTGSVIVLPPLVISIIVGLIFDRF